MADLLLAFPFELSDKDGFEKILTLFEDKGFIIHIFDGLNSNDFYLEVLENILEQIKENGASQDDRIVVFSNIKEIIFSWFRCYNSMVDEFVYFKDREDPKFLDGVSDSEFIDSLSKFYNISDEHIEGKIYFNLNFDFVNYEEILCTILHNGDYRYLDVMENFPFDKKAQKQQISKTYKFNDTYYTFNDNHINREIIELPQSKKRNINLGEEYLDCLLDYNVAFLLFIIIGLYKVDSKKMFNEFQKYFLNISVIDIEKKEKISKIIFNYIQEKHPTFVEKVHLLSFTGIMNNKSLEVIQLY